MREITVNIHQQGAIKVNHAHIHRESPDIACIVVDLGSKRAEYSGSCGGGDSGDPTHHLLDANDETLHTVEGNTEFTIITFPDFSDWTEFSGHVERYTLYLCLTRRPTP